MVTDAIAWLCRSPRRLAVGAASIIAVLLVGGSALFGGGTAGADGEPAERAPAAAADPVAQVPDAEPYVQAAVAFVTQWSRLEPGRTAAQWQAALTPLATPEFATVLRTVDPAALPGVGPSGEPVVRFVSRSSSLVAVPLADGSSVLVTVVQAGTRPLVSDVQPNVGD